MVAEVASDNFIASKRPDHEGRTIIRERPDEPLDRPDNVKLCEHSSRAKVSSSEMLQCQRFQGFFSRAGYSLQGNLGAISIVLEPKRACLPPATAACTFY